eukprot:5799969-Amphidinium_carterae.1
MAAVAAAAAVATAAAGILPRMESSRKAPLLGKSQTEPIIVQDFYEGLGWKIAGGKINFIV